MASMSSTVTRTASAIQSASAEVRIHGVAKYAVLFTLLIGVGALAYLTHFVPADLGLVAIGTGLTAALAYVVHEQERPHRMPGLPRYSTLAALTGAAVVYYLVGWLMTLPIVQLGAAMTWLALAFGYVMSTATEDRTRNLTANQANWITGFLGLGLVAMGWLQRDVTMAIAALVVTAFAVFPQVLHLSQDSAA